MLPVDGFRRDAGDRLELSGDFQTSPIDDDRKDSTRARFSPDGAVDSEVSGQNDRPACYSFCSTVRVSVDGRVRHGDDWSGNILWTAPHRTDLGSSGVSSGRAFGDDIEHPI